MNAEELKALLICYWRFKRGCEIVATEFDYGAADIISLNYKRQQIYETEVKLSIGDMRREKNKRKHTFATKDLWGTTRWKIWANQFYFAVPEDIEEKARDLCKAIFPYAGLLVAKNVDTFINDYKRHYSDTPVSVVIKAKSMPATGIDNEVMLRLARGMSNSLASRSYELIRQKRGLNG